MSDEKELQDRITGTAVDGRIQCAQALAIAKDMRIPPGRVGEMLNQMDVRIIKCQLGCFP
jgi:LAO/AO transport system kinase